MHDKLTAAISRALRYFLQLLHENSGLNKPGGRLTPDALSALLRKLRPTACPRTRQPKLRAAVPATVRFLVYSDLVSCSPQEVCADLAACAAVLGGIAPTVLLVSGHDVAGSLGRLPGDGAVLALGPAEFGLAHSINPDAGVKCVQLLDNLLPNLQLVLAHGLSAAQALSSDRRFAFRLVSRLHYPGQNPVMDHEAAQSEHLDGLDMDALKLLLLHSAAIWGQGRQLEKVLSACGSGVGEAGSRCAVFPVAAGAAAYFSSLELSSGSPLVCFSGHDFKFVDPYISRLKKKGLKVIRDQWDWGSSPDTAWSEKCFREADILFCEWGLANAVWYSKLNTQKKPLYIRVHLQETGDYAARFGHGIEHGNVTSFLFVSNRVRQEAIRKFGWPEEKTSVIPNFVLTDEYAFREKDFFGPVRLGMVGIVPPRKRFDRAIKLLELLLQRGVDATLFIKGRRPEHTAFMKTRRYAKDIAYYTDLYGRIDADPLLKERVIFDPWANDVALWYEKIHFILSCSDFESFHYALADGVASGCLPIVWPWEEAAEIYPADWLVKDTRHAASRIAELLELPDNVRQCMALHNRKLIVDRYGSRKIFSRLDSALGLEGFGAFHP